MDLFLLYAEEQELPVRLTKKIREYMIFARKAMRRTYYTSKALINKVVVRRFKPLPSVVCVQYVW